MRLIDADKLKISYDGHFVGVARNDLDNAPTVEAQPITHAHWEPFEKEAYWFQDIEEICETGKPTKQTQYKCSHCLAEFGTIVVEQNYLYCPKCNAKMDEEVEECSQGNN